MNIQQMLDSWLGTHPEAQKYVTKLWYLPEGKDAPPEVTHKIRLSSAASAERAITIGLVVKPEFALVLDALLAMVRHAATREAVNLIPVMSLVEIVMAAEGVVLLVVLWVVLWTSYRVWDLTHRVAAIASKLTMLERELRR